jgi:hypothetical protein
MPGSNRRPLPCEGSALPAAPIARGCLANRTVGHDREVDTSPRDTPDAHRRRPGRVEPGADSGPVRRRCREGRSGSGHARDARTECVRDRPERATWPARFVIRSRHPLESLCRRNSDNADVAQLVAHHLAKVRVASSSLVIRSDQAGASRFCSLVVNPAHGGLAERRGSGLQSRIHGFESRIHLETSPSQLTHTGDWRSGSALP